MRHLHVSPGVVHGATRIRTEKIDQELLFAGDAILSSMVPEAFQPRIRHEAWQQVSGDRTDRVIASETFIE
jgi:hypothetical protein